MKAIHQTFNPYSWVLTLTACLFFGVVSAQESQINTLQKQLQQGSTTAQVDLRNNLANLLSGTKSDEAKKYAEEAEKMARKISYLKGEADALSILGVLMAHDFDRADLAAKYHEKAFGIYKSLKVKGQFSEAQMKNFLTNTVLPTYQFVLNEENSGRRTKKAFKAYQNLDLIFTKYLNESIKETQGQLSQTESRLSNTSAELQNKQMSEKQLILEKIKISDNLEAKEIEATALSDSLTIRELESKNQAMILLQKQAEVDKQEILNFSLKLGIGLGSLLLLVIVWLWWQQYKNNQLLIEQKAALAQKNQEINIQKEEILAQHDNIEQQNAILYQQKEEIEAQRDNLSELHEQVIQQRDESNGLLLNILPAEIAQELKETGHATPKYYDMATVLFTDFKGFTQISEKLTPEQIIHELDHCFLKFDEIIEKYNVEKIKTIGDAYMCAGGIPIPNRTNALDVVKAGLEMKEFMEQFKAEKQAKGEAVWELRIGIHTGPLVAGVIGKNKFAYDIWGDTVNIASRMESSGEVGKVNISETTYELVKSHFQCTHRGKIAAKNKGEIDMYFVDKKTSLFQGIRNLNAQASSVGA